MHDSLVYILSEMKKEHIDVAVLDFEDFEYRILVSRDCKAKIIDLINRCGWKRVKNKINDEYLYGMDRFLYYSREKINLIICFQIACKSTLHGEWIPLDRKINNFALSSIVYVANIPVLCPEDELCYLLSKCVYTEKKFSNKDISRIESLLSNINKNMLMPKLEGVFFKFTPRIFNMIVDREYNQIISEFFRFASY